MNRNNSLDPFYFQLTLFVDYGSLRYLFLSLSLLIYMTIISSNVVIIVAVCLEKLLHQPMYIFICCMSLNSLYGSAGFFPRFLMDILSNTHLISRPSCFIQIYVIYSYAACEMIVLGIMAYDRFVAICQPLHYHSKMTIGTVRYLVIFAVISPACSTGICVYLTVKLPLCGTRVPRLFCSVVHLSCVDTTVNQIAGILFTTVMIIIPLLFILYTYLHILLVCRRSSSEFRQKALQTCLPHIVTFIIYVFTLFCELLLSRIKADEVNPVVIVVLSLEFVMIPPIINPLIYGLNLPMIREVVLRFYKLHKMRPAA